MRPMRRKHSEITDPDRIQEILTSATIGRLSTIGSDGYPYITPVNYVFHRGNIYFHCAPKGEKLDNIARDPKVCFQVDIPLAYLDSRLQPDRSGCKVHQLYHCVIIRGEARILDNGPRKAEALNALVASHEKDGGFTEIHEDMPECKACLVVEIKPGAISAKSDLVQNKSAEDRLTIARYLKKRNQSADIDTIRALGFDPDNL